MGYPTKGITCALNIPKHEQCPSDSLDQNNLAHGVYWIPQVGYHITFLVSFGRVMQYSFKFQKICYGAQCI